MVRIGKAVFGVIGKIGGSADWDIGRIEIDKIPRLNVFTGRFKISCPDLNVGFPQISADIAQILFAHGRPACPVVIGNVKHALFVDAVKTVSVGIKAYKEQTGGSLLIITHNTKILDALTVDKTHIIADGLVAAEGGSELTDEVAADGFEKYI